MVLGVGDGLGGEVCVERWVGHRLYPPPRMSEEGRGAGGEEGEGAKRGSEGGEGVEGWKGGKKGEDGEEREGEITKFWLWGEETEEAYQLDTVFFQNWYGYQDEVVRKGGGMDLMQVLCVRVPLFSSPLPGFLSSSFLLLPFSQTLLALAGLKPKQMFDAGGSYLCPPWWVPFGRTLSRVAGIVLGRWVGGMMGYQPFYKKWTGDWEVACGKMETSVFQRRFARRKED